MDDSTFIPRPPSNSSRRRNPGNFTASRVLSSSNENKGASHLPQGIRQVYNSLNVDNQVRSKFQVLLKTFHALDTDATRSIETKKFFDVLERHNILPAESKIQQFTETISRECNGRVNFQEFLELFRPEPTSTEKAAAQYHWDQPPEQPEDERFHTETYLDDAWQYSGRGHVTEGHPHVFQESDLGVANLWFAEVPRSQHRKLKPDSGYRVRHRTLHNDVLFEPGMAPMPEQLLHPLSTAAQAFQHLQAYWQMRFYQPLQAFKSMDVNHRNTITQDDVLQSLRQAGYTIPHHEAGKLMQIFHGGNPQIVDGKPGISYPQFMAKLIDGDKMDRTLGKNTMQLRKPRLNKTIVSNDVGWSVAAAHIREKMPLLERAFELLDVENTGALSKEDVRQAVLRITGTPLSEAQFQHLTNLAPRPDGNIDYHRLLFEVKHQADVVQIKQGNTSIEVKVTPKPKIRMDYAKIDHLKRVNRVPRVLSAGQYQSLMTSRVQMHFDEILTALKVADPNQTDHVQQTEMWQILKTYAINIPLDEFQNMLRVLGLGKSEQVNYRLFLSMFNKGVIDSGRNFQQLVPEFCLAQTCSKILGTKGDQKHKLVEFEKEINELKNNKGLLSKRDFRQLINKYTGSQIPDHEFTAACHSYEQGQYIRTEPYLKTLRRYAQRREITAAKEDELQKVQGTIQLGHYHMDRKNPTQRRVKSRFSPNGYFMKTCNRVKLSAAAKAKQPRRGALSKESPLMFLNQEGSTSGLDIFSATMPGADGFQTVPPLSTDGFQSTQPLSARSSISPTPIRSPSGNSAAFFNGHSFETPRRPATSDRVTRTRRGIPLVSPLVPGSRTAEVESRLKQQVASKWKMLNQCFHKLDKKNTGLVSISRFKSVLSGANILVEPEDMDVLVFKYGDHLSRNIEYQRFLDFMVGNRSRTEQRRPNLPESQSKEAFSQVEAHWKDIRKSLKEFDPKNQGQVEPQQLKSVLHYYNVDLSADQMQSILNKYGTNQGAKISYNKFLRSQLAKHQKSLQTY